MYRLLFYQPQDMVILLQKTLRKTAYIHLLFNKYFCKLFVIKRFALTIWELRKLAIKSLPDSKCNAFGVEISCMSGKGIASTSESIIAIFLRLFFIN